MTDDRQSQIDRDLERFYARNPKASPTALLEESSGRSPLDMGTVSLSEIAEAIEFPSFGDMDFAHETMPILRKRLVWDIIPHTEQIQQWGEKLGVTPGSAEGDVIEEAAADGRRGLLIPLMPLVHLMAAEAGAVVSKARALADDNLTQPDGSVLVMSPEHDVTAEVRSGTLAVIANLLEMGILAYGKVITDV